MTAEEQPYLQIMSLLCRGRQIKDIAWFMVIMSVLLLFIGAGTYPSFTASGDALLFFLISDIIELRLFTMYLFVLRISSKV